MRWLQAKLENMLRLLPCQCLMKTGRLFFLCLDCVWLGISWHSVSSLNDIQFRDQWGEWKGQCHCFEPMFIQDLVKWEGNPTFLIIVFTPPQNPGHCPTLLFLHWIPWDCKVPASVSIAQIICNIQPRAIKCCVYYLMCKAHPNWCFCSAIIAFGVFGCCWWLKLMADEGGGAQIGVLFMAVHPYFHFSGYFNETC